MTSKEGCEGSGSELTDEQLLQAMLHGSPAQTTAAYDALVKKSSNPSVAEFNWTLVKAEELAKVCTSLQEGMQASQVSFEPLFSAVSVASLIVSKEELVQQLPHITLDGLAKSAIFVAKKNSDKKLLSRVLWGFAREKYPMFIYQKYHDELIDLITESLCDNQSAVIAFEGLKILIFLLINVSLAVDKAVDFFPEVFRHLFHKLTRVRRLALKCTELLLGQPDCREVLAAVVKKAVPEITASYCKVLCGLIDESQLAMEALLIWKACVKMLGRRLHSGTTLINSLLAVIERGFKSSESNVRVEAFKCWSLLIDNFSLDKSVLHSNKRLRLLAAPFVANNAKNEDIFDAKLKSWWHLLICVEDSVAIQNFELLVVPLLQLCFKNPIGSASPKSPSGSSKNLKSPTAASPILQCQFVHILFSLMISERQDLLPDCGLERLQRPLVGSGQYGKHHGLIHESVHRVLHLLIKLKCSSNLATSLTEAVVRLLSDHLKVASQREGAELLKDLFKVLKSCLTECCVETETVNSQSPKVLMVNSMLELVSAMVSGPASIASSVLTSRHYHLGGGNDVMRGTLASSLVDFLFLPSVLAAAQANLDMYRSALKAVLLSYKSDGRSRLEYIEAVRCCLDSLLASVEAKQAGPLSSDATPVASLMSSVWLVVAQALKVFIDEMQTMNDCSESEDLGCVYCMLLLPLQHSALFFTDLDESAVRSLWDEWSVVYRSCDGLALLSATARPHHSAGVVCKQVVLTLSQCVGPPDLHASLIVFCCAVVSSCMSAFKFDMLSGAASEQKACRKRTGGVGGLDALEEPVNAVVELWRRVERLLGQQRHTAARHLTHALDVVLSKAQTSRLLLPLLGALLGTFTALVKVNPSARYGREEAQALVRTVGAYCALLQGHCDGELAAGALALVQAGLTSTSCGIVRACLQLWRTMDKSGLTAQQRRATDSLAAPHLEATQLQDSGGTTPPRALAGGGVLRTTPRGSCLGRRPDPSSPAVSTPDRGSSAASRAARASPAGGGALLCDDDGVEFVPISSGAPAGGRRPLTPHQRARLRQRRSDIPALYSDLSQNASQSDFSQHASQSDQSCSQAFNDLAASQKGGATDQGDSNAGQGGPATSQETPATVEKGSAASQENPAACREGKGTTRADGAAPPMTPDSPGPLRGAAPDPSSDQLRPTAVESAGGETMPSGRPSGEGNPPDASPNRPAQHTAAPSDSDSDDAIPDSQALDARSRSRSVFSSRTRRALSRFSSSARAGPHIDGIEPLPPQPSVPGPAEGSSSSSASAGRCCSGESAPPAPAGDYGQPEASSAGGGPTAGREWAPSPLSTPSKAKARLAEASSTPSKVTRSGRKIVPPKKGMPEPMTPPGPGRRASAWVGAGLGAPSRDSSMSPTASSAPAGPLQSVSKCQDSSSAKAKSGLAKCVQKKISEMFEAAPDASTSGSGPTSSAGGGAGDEEEEGLLAVRRARAVQSYSRRPHRSRADTAFERVAQEEHSQKKTSGADRAPPEVCSDEPPPQLQGALQTSTNETRASEQTAAPDILTAELQENLVGNYGTFLEVAGAVPGTQMLSAAAHSRVSLFDSVRSVQEESISTAAESTSQGQELTSTAAESTSQGQELTSTAAESTSQGQELTSTAAESTSQGQELTSTAAESASQGQELTTRGGPNDSLRKPPSAGRRSRPRRKRSPAGRDARSKAGLEADSDDETLAQKLQNAKRCAAASEKLPQLEVIEPEMNNSSEREERKGEQEIEDTTRGSGESAARSAQPTRGRKRRRHSPEDTSSPSKRRNTRSHHDSTTDTVRLNDYVSIRRGVKRKAPSPHAERSCSPASTRVHALACSAIEGAELLAVEESRLDLPELTECAAASAGTAPSDSRPQMPAGKHARSVSPSKGEPAERDGSPAGAELRQPSNAGQAGAASGGVGAAAPSSAEEPGLSPQRPQPSTEDVRLAPPAPPRQHELPLLPKRAEQLLAPPQGVPEKNSRADVDNGPGAVGSPARQRRRVAGGADATPGPDRRRGTPTALLSGGCSRAARMVATAHSRRGASAAALTPARGAESPSGAAASGGCERPRHTPSPARAAAWRTDTPRAHQPWPHRPSPAASPGSSILKKTVTDSGSRGRRVSFADPPVSKSVVIASEDSPHRRELCLSPRGRPSVPLSVRAQKRLDMSRAGAAGRQQQCRLTALVDPGSLPQQPSPASLAELVSSDVSSGPTNAIYSSLASCSVPVACLLPALTSASLTASLEAVLLARGLSTVGDVARLEEADLTGLPIKPPKLQTTLAALAHFQATLSAAPEDAGDKDNAEAELWELTREGSVDSPHIGGEAVGLPPSELLEGGARLVAADGTLDGVPSPTDKASSTPADDVSSTPAEEASSTPADEASLTPADEASLIPADEASLTPADEASLIPADEVSPTPVDEVSPTPVDEVSPTPADEVSPTPADEVSSTPADEVSSTPADEVSSTPADEVSPTPADEVSPTPADEVSSTSADEISTAPADEASPIPADEAAATSPQHNEETESRQADVTHEDNGKCLSLARSGTSILKIAEAKTFPSAVINSDEPQQHQEDVQPQQHQEDVQPQQHQEGVQPQQHQEGVQPQHQEGVQPQQHQEGVQPQQHQEGVQPQQHQEGVQPQQHQEGVQPQQHQEGVQPQQHQDVESQPKHDVERHQNDAHVSPRHAKEEAEDDDDDGGSSSDKENAAPSSGPCSEPAPPAGEGGVPLVKGGAGLRATCGPHRSEGPRQVLAELAVGLERPSEEEDEAMSCCGVGAPSWQLVPAPAPSAAALESEGKVAADGSSCQPEDGGAAGSGDCCQPEDGGAAGSGDCCQPEDVVAAVRVMSPAAQEAVLAALLPTLQYTQVVDVFTQYLRRRP